MKARDERIDAAKYWLVVLVITAHVVMRKEFAGSAICAVLWNWLCTFDIPLFIFISGYFSRKKAKKDFWPSIWKLLEPLIIFHIIGLFFYVDNISIKKILTPWFMLWYLLSLIYWRLLLQIIPDKILRHKRIILFITFCIGILAGFLPLNRVLSLQRTLALMPFFFLGYYMKGKNLYLPDKYKPLCAVFLVVIFAALLFFPHRINDLFYATPYKSIYGAAIRMIAFAVAIPMSVAFINVCYYTAWTARQGRLTMQYYLYHALIIPPSSAIIIPPLILIASRLNIPMSFLSAAVIAIIIILGIGVILYFPYVKMLTNPSLFYIKKLIAKKKDAILQLHEQ